MRIAPLNTITSPALPVGATAAIINVDSPASQDGVVEMNPTSHGQLGEQTSVAVANRDVDLRLRPEFIEDNSQESNDKFKMILMQAKEHVDNNEVDQDQFQSMLQQLAKIKSDSEARKTFKRAAGGGKSTKNADNDESIEEFSSGSDDETLKQSHRVSYKRRRQDNEKPVNSIAGAINSNAGKSPQNDISNAPQKERRPRKTKWSPWEDKTKQQQQQQQQPPMMNMPTPVPPNIIPPMPFAPLRPAQQQQQPMNIVSDNVRQFSSRNVPPESVWQPNVMPFNRPPVNPLGLLNNANVPANLMNNAQIVMAQHGPSLAPCTAKDRTINIDGVPREIRFYDETAIAFMEPNGREPKEIGFQSGERRVCVDNNESIVLAFNDSYKPFVINGNQYSIRFGTPTRELYIDNEWYECYFGDPAVGIVLNNKFHSFRIDGPPPQVRIGNVRTDLVVGKVDMYVDTQTKIPLFLDAQVQMFQVNNQMHTIQFADYFLTVIIDNIPFTAKYGAMPVKFQLANSEHYIRFSILPNNIVAGEIYVQNMKRTELQPDLIAPMPTTMMTTTTPPTTANSVTMPTSMPSMASNSETAINSKSIGSQPSQAASTAAGSQSNASVISQSSSNPPTTMPVDINDLYQKLLASGIMQSLHKPNKEKDKAPPVELSKPETLKKRHPSIVSALYSGIQCSSCGIRFPLGQTIKYNHHLDWHFRENRRERDSVRRPQSRKLYLPLSEWLQYQEIENEEEREKSWFETQQTELDSANEESNQRTVSPPPSCTAGPNDNNRTCDMCHDIFETFFCEETEEWHLRNAIRIDENIYHPTCYDDFKVICHFH